MLQLREGPERATIAFAHGVLVAATYGADQGELALGAVLAMSSASFRWDPGAAVEGDLSGSLDELLARGSAARDRLAEARRMIPDDRTRFALGGGDAADRTLAVKPRQWRVLSAVDGRRDVAGIARSTGESKLATLQTLSELVELGLVRVVAAPAQSTRAARRGAAAPIARAQPEAPAPTLVAPSEAPTIVGLGDLAAEVDARLVAIAAALPPAAPARGPTPEARQEMQRPVPPEQLPAEISDMDLRDMTQVIVSHYLPPTVDRPAVGAAQPKADAGRRGGLFGLFRGRTVRTAGEGTVTLPSAAQLAQLANALLVLASRTPGSQPSRSAVRHLQRLYQARPIGRRVPTRSLGDEGGVLDARLPDLVDDAAIAADPASEQHLPLLAALVQQIRDDEGRALGAARATELYRAAVEEVFGDPRHRLGSTQMIARVATPPRARVTVRVGGTGGPYEIVGHDCSIGRSASNTIVLTESSVSGHHARLAPRAEAFVIIDLGSRNGTTVNGERIEGERMLRGGEVIGIGEAVLDFEMVRG